MDELNSTYSFAGDPPQRFVYAEGSTQRGEDQNDSMGLAEWAWKMPQTATPPNDGDLWHKHDGTLWKWNGETWTQIGGTHYPCEWQDPDAYRHTQEREPRNPELDKINDKIREVMDWPRQNMEDIRNFE